MSIAAELDVLWDENDSIPDLTKVLVHLRDLKRQITDAESALVADLANAMAKANTWQEEISGVGVLVRHSGKQRKSWDHEKLWERVRNEAKGCPCRVVDEQTGEMESDVEHVTRHYRDCCGIAYWKVTGLRRLMVDVDEYSETRMGPPSIEVQ